MNINFHITQVFFSRALVNLDPSLTTEIFSTYMTSIYHLNLRHIFIWWTLLQTIDLDLPISKPNKVLDMDKMVETRLWLLYHTEGYTSQCSSKSVALLKILNWFKSWIKRLHSKEHTIVRKTWVLWKVSICDTFSKDSETVSRCQEQIQVL